MKFFKTILLIMLQVYDYFFPIRLSSTAHEAQKYHSLHHNTFAML